MKIYLKVLEVTDVSQSYVDWFSNKKVTRYSDNQYRKFSFAGQKKYIKSCLENDDLELYGIFAGYQHIGNISIKGIKSFHKRGEINYLIGNIDYWGKGVGSLAVSKIIEISARKHKLNKLFAGLARDNFGSRNVLEKNGFKLEGTRIKHLFYGGKFYDQLDYGLIL